MNASIDLLIHHSLMAPSMHLHKRGKQDGKVSKTQEKQRQVVDASINLLIHHSRRSRDRQQYLNAEKEGVEG